MKKLSVMVGTLVALAGGCAVPAIAQPNTHRTVTFTAPFDDEGTRLRQSVECDGHVAGAGSIVYEGSGELTGALTAVDDYCGILSYDLEHQSFAGEGWDTIVGTLDGCGTGSFVSHQFDYHTSATLYDPATGRGHLTYRWEVVPGSGTKAFAGATGSGTAYADFDPPADPAHPLTVPNDGAYTGTITCPRGH
jgi:hypothetical protein